ncbi:Phosphate acetyltransferase [Corynebacterium capitovis DSM 44611]|uniref:phosphate acetyltransferase n=1 Tax=Corynebacterium capitovis TaxID=131081 RepID=UPI0003660BFB|nr:phosphate acetyltransferase [Corynebacterium capitovis]WKD58215.1 Phosphate acetyltransferase [Corynebacterium capitovis DSM 44611]
MTAPQSLLVTLANRNFDGIDLDGLAATLNLRVARVGEGSDVAEVYSRDLLAEGPALVEGTGDLSFDSELAATLGTPVLVVADDASREELVRARVEEAGATLIKVVTADELDGDLSIPSDVKPVMSPLVFESWLLTRARENRAHIVLPEGEDDRILQAAAQLLERGVVQLTILGDSDDITRRAGELGVDISRATLVNHLESELLEEFAQEFAELRKAKGITLDQARETMRDISYFGTMMVHKGLADGMVSGANHTTAHTIKPSFQIIKTAPGASVVSSIFLMVMRGRVWAFGDCAVNPNPTAQQLGEIAVVSAKTAAQFGIDPKVAMLSYSTGTSGTGPDVDRAVAAVAAARELDPELAVDGPLQFDAACDPGVGKKKAPDSPVAGHGNVFIFPDLDAGNIGYKIAQRTGGALAVGPVLQGLNKPVNDLSRGATVPDIVNTVAITAIQAGGAD